MKVYVGILHVCIQISVLCRLRSFRRLAERQGRGLPSRPWSTPERQPSLAVRWVDSSHTTRTLPPHSCPSPSHPAAPHWPRARSPCAAHCLSHSNFCHGAPQLRQDRCPACWQAWCRQSRGPHGDRSELGGHASGLLPALPSTAVSWIALVCTQHTAHCTLFLVPLGAAVPEAYGRRVVEVRFLHGPPLWDVATLSLTLTLTLTL